LLNTQLTKSQEFHKLACQFVLGCVVAFHSFGNKAQGNVYQVPLLPHVSLINTYNYTYTGIEPHFLCLVNYPISHYLYFKEYPLPTCQ